MCPQKLENRAARYFAQWGEFSPLAKKWRGGFNTPPPPCLRMKGFNREHNVLQIYEGGGELKITKNSRFRLVLHIYMRLTVVRTLSHAPNIYFQALILAFKISLG